jgi:hypothetical protein
MTTVTMLEELVKAGKHAGSVQIRQPSTPVDVDAINDVLYDLKLHVVGVREDELRLDFLPGEKGDQLDLESLPEEIIKRLRRVANATKGIRSISVG